MTATTIGRAVGVAVVIVAGALAAGRGGHEAGEQPSYAQSTISAPANSTADIAALRDHLDDRLNSIDRRLAHLEGYNEAQRDAAKSPR